MIRKLARQKHKRNLRRRRRSLSWLWWLVLILLLIIIASFACWVYNKYEQARIDPTTLCPVDGATAFLAVILDLTDPLNDQQADRLKNELERQFKNAENGTLISVGVVKAEPSTFGKRFSICKPQSGNTASPIYQNKSMIEKRYDQEFRIPLTETVESMMSGGEQDSSPIIESITSLIASHPEFRERNTPKRLILVSDLVQNSDIHSFFRGQDWSDFRQTREFANFSFSLRNFDVTIVQIPVNASARINVGEVGDFWQRYLHKHGARLKSLDTVTLGRF